MKVMPPRKLLLLSLFGVGYGAITEYRQPTIASNCPNQPAGCNTFTGEDGASYLDPGIDVLNSACCGCWGYLTMADATKNQDLNLSVKGEGDKSINSLLSRLNDKTLEGGVFGSTNVIADYDATGPEKTETDILKTALVKVDGSGLLPVNEAVLNAPAQVNTGVHKGLVGTITLNGSDKVDMKFNTYTDTRYTDVMKHADNGAPNSDRQQIRLCAPKANAFSNRFTCKNPREDKWTTEENNNVDVSNQIANDKNNCRNFGRARIAPAKSVKISDEKLVMPSIPVAGPVAWVPVKYDTKNMFVIAATATHVTLAEAAPAVTSGEGLCIFEFKGAALRTEEADYLGDDDHEFVCRDKAAYVLLDLNRGGEKAGIWIFIVVLAIVCAWPACQKWPLYKRICNADHDLCCKTEKQRIERQATASLISRQSSARSRASQQRLENQKLSSPREQSPQLAADPNVASEEALELSGSVPVKLADPGDDVNKLPDVPKSSDGS